MRAALLLPALLVLWFPIGGANAQPAQRTCGPWAEIALGLIQGYDESQRFTGLSTNGHRIEVWLDRETGTFTLLRTTPDGQTCIVDAGEAGELTNGFAGKGDPA